MLASRSGYVPASLTLNLSESPRRQRLRQPVHGLAMRIVRFFWIEAGSVLLRATGILAFLADRPDRWPDTSGR